MAGCRRGEERGRQEKADELWYLSQEVGEVDAIRLLWLCRFHGNQEKPSVDRIAEPVPQSDARR